MSDRTEVSLQVLVEHIKDVAAVYSTNSAHYAWDYIDETLDRFIVFVFSEVNNGELWDLHKLREKGIAYTSSWEHGVGYDAGSEHCRFTDKGEMVLKAISNGELNPCFDSLWKVRQLDDECTRLKELTALLDAHYEKIYIPSWVNQAEYGRLYRTRCLIGDPFTKVVI